MNKIKDTWDLTLLYKSENDPQIEKDLKAIENKFVAFERKYKGKDFTSSVQKLKQSLDAYKDLEELIDGYKLLRYFNLRKDVETQNASIQAKLTVFEQRVTLAQNKATFFTLELGKIPPSKQKQFLKDKLLAEYSYLLKVIFTEAKYHLSEKEEQLASLLAQPGMSMWVDGQERFLSNLTIKYKGNTLPIAEGWGMIAQLTSAKERTFLHNEILKQFKSASHFAGAEINAVFNFKKIMDERRGYEKPYSSTVLSYENDEETIEKMVGLISNNFKISHRFYKLHAKLLKFKKLSMSDRSVKIGEIKKKFDFRTATEIVSRSLERFDKKYAEVFTSFVEKGQIDVYPKKGKIGGAYCSGGGNNPTFVLLNHTDSVDSVETLAHEMGHAFHTEFSKSQPAHYRRYTTATAEVASTFFEQLTLESLEKELDSKDYAILLHNKITKDISTIFRQIAFFNFELELHERIRKEGELPKEEIAKLMNKHLKSYLGPVFEIAEDDGYFFVYLSHMRRFFYVYSYAYGQLISRALFEKWKEDKGYSKKIEQFLRAGGSMSPKDIFKSIGIDTSNPQFFETGLKAIEADIKKLEKLAS